MSIVESQWSLPPPGFALVPLKQEDNNKTDANMLCMTSVSVCGPTWA